MADSIVETKASASGSATELDYQAALKRVMGLADFERSAHSPEHAVFHLERMALLLERLGHPELKVPAVHIAGTKGKGSTAAMITSVLTAQGHKVGLYTSPHLHSVVERIRVGLEPIARHDFAALVEQTWSAVEWVSEHGGHGDVSTFELLTTIAFVHFKQIGADFQVLEVGLGGRLDATNVVHPEVSVITAISLDHVATLGDTLPLIAAEKAGIVKPEVPVVIGPQPAEALDVVRDIAERNSAPVVQVGEDVTWSVHSVDPDGQLVDVVGLHDTYPVRIPLLGEHQIENAATAIGAVETLANAGFLVSRESILEGLSGVRWPGRLEVLSREGGLLVVDGAHNPASIGRLVTAVRDNFSFRRAILVFGATSGHSAREMMAELAALASLLIVVRSRHPRSAPTNVIAGAARDMGLEVLFESDDVGQAVRSAMEMAREDDLVLGTGSLSVVAEVIEEINGIAPELYPDMKRPTVYKVT